VRHAFVTWALLAGRNPKFVRPSSKRVISASSAALCSRGRQSGPHSNAGLKSNKGSFTTWNPGGNKIVRLSTGNDGQAHFEDLNVPAGDTETVDLQPGADMTYRRFAVGSLSNWHNAPRVQYVITLFGQMEIGIGDGTKRMFKRHTSGGRLNREGHTIRSVGERISASVALSV
ncbi:uncharacterized protein METZ01_LOCUS270277, partial [marine metagenome]